MLDRQNRMGVYRLGSLNYCDLRSVSDIVRKKSPILYWFRPFVVGLIWVSFQHPLDAPSNFRAEKHFLNTVINRVADREFDKKRNSIPSHQRLQSSRRVHSKSSFFPRSNRIEVGTYWKILWRVQRLNVTHQVTGWPPSYHNSISVRCFRSDVVQVPS